MCKVINTITGVKKEIYGSQVVKGKNGDWVIYPIEDPVNVDDRRLRIGLIPTVEYANHFGITWNLEEHLKTQNEN